MDKMQVAYLLYTPIGTALANLEQRLSDCLGKRARNLVEYSGQFVLEHHEPESLVRELDGIHSLEELIDSWAIVVGSRVKHHECNNLVETSASLELKSDDQFGLVGSLNPLLKQQALHNSDDEADGH